MKKVNHTLHPNLRQHDPTSKHQIEPTLCIPCLDSSKSIKLQVIRKLKYIFHCKHTKVITYSFNKTFQTLKHFFPIKAYSKHRSNFYSTYKYHHKGEPREESLYRKIKKTVKRPTRQRMKQKSDKEANRQKL